MTVTELLPPDGLPPARYRLSTRIVASSVVALVVVLGMIGTTLWLSWRLEGAGAAINDTGSLRMRAHSVAVELMRPEPSRHEREQRLRGQLDLVDYTLASLHKGNPQRPLLLPLDPQIRAQFNEVAHYWRTQAKPSAEQALVDGDTSAYLAGLPKLASLADTLVGMIERDNAGKTTALRAAQGGLALLAAVGTLAMIYLLYLWIIAPVLKLRGGLQRLAVHDFSLRLPVETRDELGVLAAGYNQVADELESLYHGLEQRVDEKTRQLALQNAEITALYDMAAFLNEPNDIEAMCDGFLGRVLRQFHAQGASIRTLDPENQRLSLVSSIGLSETLTTTEHCMHVNDCHCGLATQDSRAIVIRDLRRQDTALLNCQREGFASVAVFRIVSREEVLGSLSLHFREQTDLPASARKLLGSLGQLLGVALENRRLDAQSRELAVVQERSLVAQGLHDSIAQGLNFLNLQLQLMQDAVMRDDRKEINDILPLLRAGVEESYQDVRELLTNYRSKLEQGDLTMNIEDTVKRFRRQTGYQTALDIQYRKGAPLAPDQQLQVLFILQEALSNVRKHSGATHVHVRVENAHDFTLAVQDDGQGYDPAEVARRGEAHVGLHIMRERAARMNARIRLESAVGQGTLVELILPASERMTA